MTRGTGYRPGISDGDYVTLGDQHVRGPQEENIAPREDETEDQKWRKAPALCRLRRERSHPCGSSLSTSSKKDSGYQLHSQKSF